VPRPSDNIDVARCSRGLSAVLLAQFLTAVADNALLFATLALIKDRHYPAGSAPWLQEFFVVSYILLAPFSGALVDAMPKGRVMLIANGLKLLATLGMCLGLNPFLAYGLVGIGAAIYSPAKYGILSELTTANRLVKANSLMETVTIAAILIGAITGGILADWSVTGTLIGVTLGFASAAGATLLIPVLPPEHSLDQRSLAAILSDFRQVSRRLIRTADTRFAIVGTSLFWGAGSTMRFLLVAWVPVALGIVNNRMPAYLNALVAVGIVGGAALAARWVSLEKVNRALPAGVLLGVTVCLLANTRSLGYTLALMLVIGGCGGFFVVPLNALLQQRGHQSVGAGHAIAVQSLGENLSMLLMVGVYALALHLKIGVARIAFGFGLMLAFAMLALWLHRISGARLVAKVASRRR